MQVFKLLLAATLSISSICAQAQTYGTYGFASLSSSAYKSEGIRADSSGGGSIGLGVKFNKNFGAEAGYVYHGKIKSICACNSEATGDSYTVALTGFATLADVDPRFSVGGKLGVSANNIRIQNAKTGSALRDSVSSNGVFAGVGIRYAFSSFSLYAEYEYFPEFIERDNGKFSATRISGGLALPF